METNEMLSLQEIEQLCQAYLDCRLSRLQEKELELVLLSSDHTSPLIAEVRTLMRLSALMATDNAKANVKNKIKSRIFKYIGIAACISAVAMGVAYCFMGLQPPETAYDIYVCIDGKVITGRVAQSVVNYTEEESMNMLKSIVEDVENEQHLSAQYLNTLK